jgi:fimbrial chaperone protein
MRRAAYAMLVAILLLGLASRAADAGALQVSPLTVTLSDDQPIVTMRVRNVDRRQVIMQADVVSWSQPDGQDAYATTGQVVVIPPIFSLAPGAQQLLRVGLPEPLAGSDVERAYRIFLRELQPVEALADGQLHMALRIGLPIFVPPRASRAGELAWSLVDAEGAWSGLRVSNRSAEHIKITAVRFLTREGSISEEVGMLRYCLPNMDIAIPLPRPKNTAQITAIQVIFTSKNFVKAENIDVPAGALDSN